MRGGPGKSLWEFRTAPSETFIAPSDEQLCAAGDFSPLGGFSLLLSPSLGGTRGTQHPRP